MVENIGYHWALNICNMDEKNNIKFNIIKT